VVYGLYTALAYLTPILGGAISDRWLGRKSAVILGGLIMALGHFMMASESLFYPALATIALGNGLFLPNLPSQVGALYADTDVRRRSAYNIYYVGINLGAFLAPLACGGLGELYGWHWGFTLAGVGMLTGLMVYLAGARHLPPQPPRSVPRSRAQPGADQPGGAILLLLAVGLAVVLLRGAYEQIGNTVALWTDTQVDRTIVPGVVVPMTWFQALNPLLIFVLTPALVSRWTRLAAEGREPAPAVKMAIGAAGIAAAYLLLAAATAVTSAHGGRTGWIWLVAFVAVLTWGELYVLPVGLGLFARLAPTTLAATTVAGWFLATFAGNLVAGALGALWSAVAHPLFFLLMAALAGAASLLLLLLDAPTRRVETRRSIRNPTRPLLEPR